MNYYFAYGSNLSREQMADLCPGSRPLFKAELSNYRLDFTHYSSQRGGGTANIVKSQGDRLWGGVYEVTAEDLEALDRREGRPPYERIRLVVQSDSGATLECWTYHVIHKKGPFEPSEGYLELLIEGAAEWQLPSEYLEFLKAIEFADEDHDHDH